MSSRRSRSRASSGGASRISDEQIRDLVAKLQALLPEARQRSNDRVRTLIPPAAAKRQCEEIRSASSHYNSTVCVYVQVPSARVLQETCSYIRNLHRDVDDLSNRLSELLATADVSTAQAAVIRSLLM